MYFDLFLPFPIAEVEQSRKKKDKGKNKALSTGGISSLEQPKRSCWDGLRAEEKDAFARDVALAGHCELTEALGVPARSSSHSGILCNWVYGGC